jgi:hypothetical protein
VAQCRFNNTFVTVRYRINTAYTRQQEKIHKKNGCGRPHLKHVKRSLAHSLFAYYNEAEPGSNFFVQFATDPQDNQETIGAYQELLPA